MCQITQKYEKIQVMPFIEAYLVAFVNKINEFESNLRNPNYRMMPEERMKGQERKELYRKVDDVKKILSMSQTELYKHQYMKYRIKRLEEHFEFFREQCHKYYERQQDI